MKRSQARVLTAAVLMGLAPEGTILASEVVSPAPAERDPTPAYVSPSELKNVIARANAGDTRAAIRLFDYYEIEKQDGVESIKWLKRAAEAGDPIAEHNLGVVYMSGGPLDSPVLGKYWTERAKEHGYVEQPVGPVGPQMTPIPWDALQPPAPSPSRK